MTKVSAFVGLTLDAIQFFAENKGVVKASHHGAKESPCMTAILKTQVEGRSPA